MLTERDPIPRLRDDIEVFPYLESGEDWCIFFDRQRYTSEPYYLALPADVARFDLVDGTRTAEHLAALIAEREGRQVSPLEILRTFNDLERRGYLDTTTFRQRRSQRQKAFYQAKTRKPFHAGYSYPGKESLLSAFLQKLFSRADTDGIRRDARAIVVPHIDLKLGAEAYARAYTALADSDADLFVIIGTSHYGSQDLFIPSERNYATPLGVVETDTALVRAIRSEVPFDLDGTDIAHRAEHSIEFQALFLQYLFGRRNFTILPVLVTSFQPFVERSTPPSEALRFRQYIKALRKVLHRSRRKVAFIASADLAHVGRKFGDPFEASTMLQTVGAEDRNLLESLVRSDSEQFFQAIARVDDRRRICGLPPVYTMLEACRPENGRLLHYDQWHERETRSAVTYASLAYYE